MCQPAQSFVSGGSAASDWTSDGIAPMAFTVWLSCWTSQQLPDGLMLMKKDGGCEGKLTFMGMSPDADSDSEHISSDEPDDLVGP